MGSKIILILFTMTIHLSAFAQIANKIEREAKIQTEYAFKLCKHLHQNPELSFHEFETAKRMVAELKLVGFEVTENFGGNSIVGVLKNGDGPVIMLRTDMDALPIKEKTEFEFASTKTAETEDGDEVAVMHACGHDIHMSTWTGTVRTLVALKEEWKG
ncbi:MAG: M20/M25/M40 family metallo-hydrolase, partial [Bacteroidetes bacterium]|nr:M20/M25/M40 family metallo-hydrolase [Bacteroidota bacterium]